MSKLANAKYYLLVAIVGIAAASAATALFLVYTELWQLTQAALAYSIYLFIPLAFGAICLSYFIVKRFAKTKTTGSGTHTVLEAYHLTNGEVSARDTAVKPAAAMLTIGLGGSAGPEGPSLLVGGGIASAFSRRFKVRADLRRRLFIAGAAAGLAATFRTPLTGGHIDDLARFVNASTIVCAFEDNTDDADYEALKENYDLLCKSTDQDGKPLKIIKLPMPKVESDEGYRLPASYTNFYIGNTKVLVPVFDHPNDAKALAILQELFPTRKVVGICCKDLVYGFGTLHCISQQQPCSQ